MDLDTPRVMGILNITPDSFYKDSRALEKDILVDRVGQMIVEGADIIDLGAISTRPGADIVNIEEEVARLLPAVEIVRKNYPDIWISVDTWRGEVLKQVAPFEIDIVNDVSGGKFDEGLLRVVGELKLPYILMHMPGNLNTMHEKSENVDIIHEVSVYFHEKVLQLNENGIWDIILDPGFGFGKTILQNYQLLGHLDHFDFFGLPSLVGISRKSMIQKVIVRGPEEALNGTTALHMIALQKGASILRVHDVKEAKEAILLHQQLSEIASS